MHGRSPFETIVVGVDGDEGGRDALAFAARLKRTFGSKVIAVLADPHDAFVTRASSPAYEAAASDEARQSLAREHELELALQLELERELERARVDAEPEVATDSSPRRALHGAAARHGADLIVVGTDRHGALARVLGADRTAATLHGAPCPVAVAPRGLAATPPHRLCRVAVGFDGTAGSRAALDLAHAVARAAAARLQVLWVVAAAIPVDPWVSRADALTKDDRVARERAEALVAEVVSELGDRAVGDALPGVAHVELAWLSREVDLLVVGSRCHGALHRLLRGSTVARLVRHAACPVLVVPHDVKRRASAPAEPATIVRKAA